MLISGPTMQMLFLFSTLVTAVPQLEESEARVMVVGDIMMHSPITASGYDAKSDSYDFSSIFSEVDPIFDQADLVIGNLETPVAGAQFGYSGYPRFNAPTELIYDLKDAGVDVLTTANNHSLDQWESGAVNTINNLDQAGILHTGTFKSQEDKDTPLIIDVNGIRIGLIAYTYGTNGMPIPEDKPYMVNILDLKSIENDVKQLKSENADYIIAMIHYGNEYQRIPSKEQIEWTDKMLELGIDFVLGSHPHVVQPLKLTEGNAADSDSGVIYSLGNFLSNQRSNWKDYGIILDLKLEKNLITQKIELTDVNVIPTYVDIYWSKGKKEYKIIPIDEESGLDETIISNGDELLEHVFQYN